MQPNRDYCKGGPACPPPSTLIAVLFRALEKPPFLVEQAARLAMPAVTPAERHTPEVHGSSNRHPARTTARSTSTRRRKVEQAARLAMPAVTPAEPHTRHTYGVSECRPAPTPPRSTSTRPFSSYLRVLRGLFFSVSSVSSVVCFFRALPTHRPPCNRTLPSVRPSVSVPSFPTSVSSVVCFSPCPPCPLYY